MQGWNICFYTPILHRGEMLEQLDFGTSAWDNPLLDLHLVFSKGRTKVISDSTYLYPKLLHNPFTKHVDSASSALQLILPVDWTQWPRFAVHLPLVGSRNELGENTDSPNIWAHLESRIELDKNWVQVYYRETLESLRRGQLQCITEFQEVLLYK